MGVRQRAAIVMGLVTMVLVGLALAPAGAQLITIPDPTSTSRPDGGSTTTVPTQSTTTTADVDSSTSSTTSSGSRSNRPTTTTGARSSSDSTPPSTARRAPSTTTASAEPPATSFSLRPTTTEVDALGGLDSTTTTGDLAVKQAASSSGSMSASNLVALVIAGLLAVALALSALTVRYVRSTRPGDRFIA